MTKKMMRIGVAGATLLGAALSVGFTSGGAVAASGPDDISRHLVAESSASGTSASDYWTPARMQAAVPADTLVADNIESTVSSVIDAASTVVAGVARTVAPQEPQAAIAPVSHIGKVFFTLGGTDYVCSGNSIASQNGNTVATAGHCVNEGPGDYATQWVFVPAYENGSAPYGEFEAQALYAPSAWVTSGDINYDTGFAIVTSADGSSLSDTVGASAVAFNQSRGLSYSLFGYPAAPPFDGETLQSCSGSASDDTYGGTDSQGVDCDMTGGSSGGPWFIGSGTGGAQNSINSFGYNTVADTMFGPYWGSVIEDAYDLASTY